MLAQNARGSVPVHLKSIISVDGTANGSADDTTDGTPDGTAHGTSDGCTPLQQQQDNQLETGYRNLLYQDL